MEKAVMDLSYFMDNVKPEQVEYPAPKRFKDKDGNRINLIFRILSEEEMREIRKHHKKRKIVTDPKTKKPYIVNGSVAMDETYDSTEAMMEMLVESLVYPNLKDQELMKFYKCLDAIKMPLKVFRTADELLYVFSAFDEIHGFGDKGQDSDKDSGKDSNLDIEKAKN